MKLSSVLTVCALAGCGCSRSEPVAAATQPAQPPYNTEIDVDEVMVHVMDPAARAFWAGWGEVYDSTGLHDVSAKTDEDWKKVEDGATMVVLATNTLMLPQYQRKPGDVWNKWAKQVADLALEGRIAADQQDKSAMETIGGKLDVACDDCHKAFRPEKKDPAAAPK